MAYAGTVIGAHCCLKTVTSAKIRPRISPPIIQRPTVSGSALAKYHVQAADADARNSSKPVLFTVPCSDIVSPPTATALRSKVFEFKAGLEVLKRLGIAILFERFYVEDTFERVRRFGPEVAGSSIQASQSSCQVVGPENG